MNGEACREMATIAYLAAASTYMDTAFNLQSDGGRMLEGVEKPSRRCEGVVETERWIDSWIVRGARNRY